MKSFHYELYQYQTVRGMQVLNYHNPLYGGYGKKEFFQSEGIKGGTIIRVMAA